MCSIDQLTLAFRHCGQRYVPTLARHNGPAAAGRYHTTDAKAGTRFARWLLGMDDRNVVKYPKKSLNHPRVSRIFGRYCQDGGTVMDRARKIALKHSAQLVTLANAK